MGLFRVRSDLERAVIDGFALPLGIAPGDMEAPAQGYTIAYNNGEQDEPDTYSFYVAVSHERVAAILRRAFDLLPDDVFGIVEISSRDAYRPIDVYIGDEEIGRGDFLEGWRRCESILLEDGSIAAGANGENPYVEVFLDQWKGISIIVPLEMRDEVESMLGEFGLDEVPHTWTVDEGDRALEETLVRPVIETEDGVSPDIDDVLLELRHDWRLELNVDPDTNLDGAGRELGMTLWHAIVGVESADGGPGADISFWATAASLGQLESLIADEVDREGRWRDPEIFSTDRVAFDERPDELSELTPKRVAAEVHLVSIERRVGS